MALSALMVRQVASPFGVPTALHVRVLSVASHIYVFDQFFRIVWIHPLLSPLSEVLGVTSV